MTISRILDQLHGVFSKNKVRNSRAGLIAGGYVFIAIISLAATAGAIGLLANNLSNSKKTSIAIEERGNVKNISRFVSNKLVDLDNDGIFEVNTPTKYTDRFSTALGKSSDKYLLLKDDGSVATNSNNLPLGVCRYDYESWEDFADVNSVEGSRHGFPKKIYKDRADITFSDLEGRALFVIISPQGANGFDRTCSQYMSVFEAFANYDVNTFYKEVYDQNVVAKYPDITAVDDVVQVYTYQEAVVKFKPSLTPLTSVTNECLAYPVYQTDVGGDLVLDSEGDPILEQLLDENGNEYSKSISIKGDGTIGCDEEADPTVADWAKCDSTITDPTHPDSCEAKLPQCASDEMYAFEEVLGETRLRCVDEITAEFEGKTIDLEKHTITELVSEYPNLACATDGDPNCIFPYQTLQSAFGQPILGYCADQDGYYRDGYVSNSVVSENYFNIQGRCIPTPGFQYFTDPNNEAKMLEISVTIDDLQFFKNHKKLDVVIAYGDHDNNDIKSIKHNLLDDLSHKNYLEAGLSNIRFTKTVTLPKGFIAAEILVLHGTTTFNASTGITTPGQSFEIEVKGIK